MISAQEQAFKHINFMYDDIFSCDAFFAGGELHELHIYVGSVLNPPTQIEVTDYISENTDRAIEEMALELIEEY